MRTACLFLATAACGPVDLDGDGAPVTEDCNDRDPTDRRPVPLFVDFDRDGFGGPVVEVGCRGNSWLSTVAGDCDDLDADAFPGGTEVGCDAKDNDCDPATVDGPAYTVGSTWASVQAAIDVSAAGETVHLCGTIIHESIVIDRLIAIEGWGAGRTILDGSGNDTATVRVEAGLELSGVTLTGGDGAPIGGERVGGGLAVPDCTGLSVGLSDVIIEGNTSDRGGGIAVLGDDCGELYVSDTVVTDNHAQQGGGILVDAELLALLDGSEIRGNTAGRGGGVWLGGDRATLKLGPDVRIADNAATDGGGVWLDGATLDGAEGTLTGNAATRGGAIFGTGRVWSVIVTGNGAEDGGGLYVAAGELAMDAGVVEANAASADGGGISVAADGTLVLEDVRLNDNTAGGRGGAVHVGGSATLSDVQIEGDEAELGGGLSCEGCVAVASRVEIRDTVAGEAGGAVAARCGGRVDLVTSTIVGGAAPDGAAASIDGGTVRLVDHTAVLDAVVEAGGAWLSVRSGCDTTGTLEVSGGAIAVGPDALALDGVLTAPPGPSFTCEVAPDGLGGCVVPAP